MSRLLLPLLLVSPLLLLQGPNAVRSEPLAQCSGRREAQLCLVTGALSGSCPTDATSLVLGFNGAGASWPTGGGSGGGGLRDCDSVSHLKVTGWSGPEITSGHLRQLSSVSSVDILDGGLERVGANVSGNNLIDLSLARNKIVSIHELSLAECRSLTSLDLSDNRIEHLPDRLLINCRSLRILRLNGNRLAELRSEVLLGAIQLREILMQKNRFQMLHKVELGFINSQRLSLIDLRSNGLFSYQAGRTGFCGPANVTVRMHFAGCPPPTDACAAAAAVDAFSHRCVGASAHLVVTFTSCQVAVGGSARCPVRAPVPACDVAAPAAAAAAPGATASPTATDGGHRQLLSHLGVSHDGAWLVYALAATVTFALLQLIASLAVCHRLKLRIARLQVRAERLSDECPSHRYFQHPATLCSQAGLSGRMTPSGKGPSSHCGFSQFGEATSLPPPPPPLAGSAEEIAAAAAAAEDATRPLRLQEDEE